MTEHETSGNLPIEDEGAVSTANTGHYSGPKNRFTPAKTKWSVVDVFSSKGNTAQITQKTKTPEVLKYNMPTRIIRGLGNVALGVIFIGSLGWVWSGDLPQVDNTNDNGYAIGGSSPSGKPSTELPPPPHHNTDPPPTIHHRITIHHTHHSPPVATTTIPPIHHRVNYYHPPTTTIPSRPTQNGVPPTPPPPSGSPF